MIKKVKDIGNSLLINDNISISKDDKDNRYYNVLQEYLDNGGTIEPQYTQAELDKMASDKAKAEAKQARELAVQNIEVTYNSVTYQGDEVSQGRMARAILGLPDDTTAISWIAKDNTVHQLNKVDLQAILTDASTQQVIIWTKK